MDTDINLGTWIFVRFSCLDVLGSLYPL